MSVYIYDAVRTPRGKGRPDGSLAAFTPAQLVGQLVGALERRIGRDALRAAEHFTLGCVTQVGARAAIWPSPHGSRRGFRTRWPA
jgi:acetyl-CoA C-acetyltransferase